MNDIAKILTWTLLSSVLVSTSWASAVRVGDDDLSSNLRSSASAGKVLADVNDDNDSDKSYDYLSYEENDDSDGDKHSADARHGKVSVEPEEMTLLTLAEQPPIAITVTSSEVDIGYAGRMLVGGRFTQSTGRVVVIKFGNINFSNATRRWKNKGQTEQTKKVTVIKPQLITKYAQIPTDVDPYFTLEFRYRPVGSSKSRVFGSETGHIYNIASMHFVRRLDVVIMGLNDVNITHHDYENMKLKPTTKSELTQQLEDAERRAATSQAELARALRALEAAQAESAETRTTLEAAQAQSREVFDAAVRSKEGYKAKITRRDARIKELQAELDRLRKSAPA